MRRTRTIMMMIERGGDDGNDDNDPKGESSSANMFGTPSPSSHSNIFSLLSFHKRYWIISKVKENRKMVTR